MNTVVRYVSRKWRIISVGLLIKFAGTIVELLLPWMLSVILDDYVPRKDIHSILLWGGLMVLASAAGLFTNVFANKLSTRISRDITRKLRYDLFAKVMKLSCTQEDSFTASSLISRLTSDTYNVHQMIDRMQRLGVRAPILLLGGIAVTFMLEPVLTLVLVAILPLLALVVFWVSRKGVTLFTRTQKALDILIRRAQESMAGIRVIQALSKTDYEIRQFDSANTEMMRQQRSANLLMNLTNPAMNMFLNVGLTAVIVAGAYRVNAGITQPGIIIAFLSYFTIILNALMMVSRLFVLYSQGTASARRITEVLDAPEEMQIEEHPPLKDEAHIRFDKVSFSYGKVRDNLRDISFSLLPGQTLGIIGPTGSGKSTLISLLLHFYNPDTGSIHIHGQDIRSIPPELLYSMFGVVFQNDFLFAGEIRGNIDFGRGLSSVQIEEAIQTAQAEFIRQREGGLAAQIAPRGMNLSGGQKQRLLIARALAADPDILILDDSSSALDYKTDAQLRRALARNFARTTKIIIAQRVSSIKNADHILVLDQGQEIGYGTHSELMRTCDSYREIAKMQMGEAV
ncbi:ABC transporter ATP-binding protein [Breznakiella homolactica]|uniref:ABC transporter ATP-binding protein n=1 Tax=Breznakiella homolactica TaxID=2798577 RepID=A0A7T7XLV4_9SPIR|nr:ABC transporter ATP-binding protein [Breznakiella homolactica]QQO08696.1 ABC transporter ATP-binding protein/permease [Breznakiella homolactica]